MGARFVSKANDGKLVASIIDRTINQTRQLPQQVFRSEYQNFMFFHYAALQDPAMWCRLLTQSDAEKVFVIFLDPSFNILRDHISKPVTLEIDVSSSAEEIAMGLTLSPTINTSDAFSFACNRCLIAPISGSWAIFGDRRFDIAIVAFFDPNARKNFSISWPLMYSARDATHFMEKATKQLPDFFSDEFIQKYKAS